MQLGINPFDALRTVGRQTAKPKTILGATVYCSFSAFVCQKLKTDSSVMLTSNMLHFSLQINDVELWDMCHLKAVNNGTGQFLIY